LTRNLPQFTPRIEEFFLISVYFVSFPFELRGL
jgi:hypothetical protein